jgi:hypothetical protein
MILAVLSLPDVLAENQTSLIRTEKTIDRLREERRLLSSASKPVSGRARGLNLDAICRGEWISLEFFTVHQSRLSFLMSRGLLLAPLDQPITDERLIQTR